MNVDPNFLEKPLLLLYFKEQISAAFISQFIKVNFERLLLSNFRAMNK